LCSAAPTFAGAPRAQHWRDAEELLEGTVDGAGISGASHGNIEGGGVGGAGVGTLLSDLREAYLEARARCPALTLLLATAEPTQGITAPCCLWVRPRPPW